MNSSISYQVGNVSSQSESRIDSPVKDGIENVVSWDNSVSTPLENENTQSVPDNTNDMLLNINSGNSKEKAMETSEIETTVDSVVQCSEKSETETVMQSSEKIETCSDDSKGSSQQNQFIGPVMPEHICKTTAETDSVSEVYSNKLKLQVETVEKNDCDLNDMIQFKHSDNIHGDEPLNKKMRYENLRHKDIDEMCKQVLDDSSFNLSTKEAPQSSNKDESVNSEKSHSECVRILNTAHKPELVTNATSEFYTSTNDNYLRGCKWSPDGTCLLTNSNDNHLRLFDLPAPLYQQDISNIPEMKSVLKVKESDTIYDYCWYPKMTSQDPETSCFVSSCKDNPVHLWDGFTGHLRCSYRPYNHVDELSSTYSLAFSCDGHKLFCGSNKMIRIFDADRPGRDCTEIPTYSKHFGQSGIISCIVPSPLGMGMFAAGSYNRSIALYDEPKKNMVCMFEGQQGGVTHMIFSPDGTKLYSGGRKDPEIICWDLRNPGQILFVALRQVETNQRMYFDIDRTGKYLVSGNQDGTVCLWDTMEAPVKKFQDSDLVLEPVLTFKPHTDTVNGVSFHPAFPLLSTSAGQRHFPELGDSDDSDTEDVSCQKEQIDNSVKLWWFT